MKRRGKARLEFRGYSREYCLKIATVLVAKRNEFYGTFGTMARLTGMSKASISRAVNKKYVSGSLAKRMVEMGWIGPIPERPKPKKRDRKWMRTDDVELAKVTFEETYPEWAVVPKETYRILYQKYKGDNDE